MCKKCILECGSIICVLLLLITIVFWSRNYFTQLIDNMKDARRQFVEAENKFPCACSCATNNAISNAITNAGGRIVSSCRVTNETSKCSSTVERPATNFVVQKKGTSDVEEHNDSMSIDKAYEALNLEFTSWLTVLGLAWGMFGLVVPLAGYLLQHKTLKDERELINKHVDDLRSEQREKYREIDDNFKKISDMRDEFSQFKIQSKKDVHAMNEMVSKIEIQTEDFLRETRTQIFMWKRQIVAFAEYSIVGKLNQLHASRNAKVFVDERLKDIVNIVIAFDYLLESLVNWREEDVVKVRAKMLQWIDNMKLFWFDLSDFERKSVCERLRTQFNPSSEFASREDFLKILRADSEEFKWLEEFFRPFAPWKFS